ncbi:MAG: hypothetical protein JRI46_08650, partial [Deltaproteobacteria bacterium]|nr:hypothetical protein [Deltaproteobacteria bacterium]
PYPKEFHQKGNNGPLKGPKLLKKLDKKKLKGYWQHIGLYAFRRDFLLKITALPPSPLEEQEGLEQLRVLENGYKIKTVIASAPSISIDTPEDLERFKSLI